MSNENDKVFQTHEIKLSELVHSFCHSLPDSDDWKILAVDSGRDIIIIIREVKPEIKLEPFVKEESNKQKEEIAKTKVIKSKAKKSK